MFIQIQVFIIIFFEVKFNFHFEFVPIEFVTLSSHPHADLPVIAIHLPSYSFQDYLSSF
jgi:hypothetical protein